MGDEPKICFEGGGGVLLPLFGDAEQKWPRELRATLYLVGLFWCFMGVAIIADIFMTAIERVTSAKMRLYDKAKDRYYTYEVWNATVANLTLMALGSSAPEILLNVIDIFAKEFYLEGLGPGTIVGSAAFNLLMIIAVCIISIPEGQARRIKEMPVYAVTATWSILAYVWLVLILQGISPNVVEVWEAVVTFLFFPALTLLAFAADKGWIISKEETGVRICEGMSDAEIAEAEERVRQEHGRELTSEQVARILSASNQKPKNYRIGASRALFGGKQKNTVNKGGFARSFTSKTMNFLHKHTKVVPFHTVQEKVICSVSFEYLNYAVLETEKVAKITVTREGDVSVSCRVNYKTLPGTAAKGDDYQHTEGSLLFKEYETKAYVYVTIVDDEKSEEDEYFHVELSNPEIVLKTGEVDPDSKIDIGQIQKCTVTIIDDDLAGVIGFEKEEVILYQRPTEFEEKIIVVRKGGACGKVSVDYVIESDSAIAGRDFEDHSGTLVFEHEKIEAYIPVVIKAVPRFNNKDRFRIKIDNPAGGAKIREDADGGPERNYATVTIMTNPADTEKTEKVISLMQQRWDKSAIGRVNWKSQFMEAIFVNGDDDEGGASPTWGDYIGHVLTVPWKLLFACVPPTDYCGGWACFTSALLMIGLVTMVIGDMASLLGCCMCIPDEITAITFVALGTSLPDTFASRTAAMQDPHADASIGNVTGSNSVNVFLGLGMPWTVAAIYWAITDPQDKWYQRFGIPNSDLNLDFLGPVGAREMGFVVPAGTLGFSVSVFALCAVLAIALLQARRTWCDGELGGPAIQRYASAGFLVFLWFSYIGISAWKAMETSPGACPP